jgi:hypothetical protein
VKHIKHTLSVILLLAFFANSLGLMLNKPNNKATAYEMAEKAQCEDEKGASEKDSNDEKYHKTYIFSVLRTSTAIISHQYIFELPKITLGIFMPPPEIA